MNNKWKLPCPHGDQCFNPDCFGSYSQQELNNLQYSDNLKQGGEQYSYQYNVGDQQKFQGGYQGSYHNQFEKKRFHPYQRRHDHHKDGYKMGGGFNHGGPWKGHYGGGPCGRGPFHHWPPPPPPPPGHWRQFDREQHRNDRNRDCHKGGRGRRREQRGDRREHCYQQSERQKQSFDNNSKETQIKVSSYQQKGNNRRLCRRNKSRSSSSQKSFKSFSSNQSGLQQLNQQLSQKSLELLMSKGHMNNHMNEALLTHYNDNIDKVQKCLNECKSQRAKNELLGEYHDNFLILQYLGYPQKIGYWKVMAILERSKNNLKVALQKLKKKIENIEHNNKVYQLTQNCNFNYIQTIPQNPFVIIDVSNVVRTNKHFKKLTSSSNSKQKLQAIFRLKILVETLFEGCFVLDYKILDDAVQKEITQKIGVDIEGQKKMEVFYADEKKKADDKIVQIIKKMPPEDRKRILMVTSDKLLLKQCQQLIGNDMPVIGGKIFIKQCKFKLQKGVRNRIIKGTKSDRYQNNN